MFTMGQNYFYQGTNRIRGPARKVPNQSTSQPVNHKGERAGREGAKDTEAEDSFGEVEAQQVEGGGFGAAGEVGGLDLYGVGTASHDPLRIRGGGEEDDSDEESTKEPPEKKSRTNERTEETEERPDSWKFWELDKQCLRPPPLDPPRRPDMAYVNMTVNGAQNEDGMEHFSLAKDRYRRSDAQVDAVREARRDQRRFGGGIYRCIENGKTNLFLHIRKGSTNFVIITLLRVEQNQKPVVQFETFAKMDYEYYTYSDGMRIRKNLPDETETGFIWYGHGGSTNPLASSVYTFCERVDNDVHFSVGPCERITQAPGASQMLCSSKQCGIVYWHLAVKFFERLGKQDYREAGQEDFALIEFKSGGRPQELLWTDKDKVRTRWSMFESVPEQESKTISTECMKRVEFVIKKGLLPPSSFPPPCYSPFIESWQELDPLRRIPPSSPW